MTEWFRKAFGAEYLNLYAHRNASEASAVVELILKHTALPAGSLVLDAPCGAGRHLEAFAERGMQAAGFDLSQALLEKAVDLETLTGRVVRADIRSIPFKPARFDLVVNLFSSLGYFDSDEDNLKVVRDLVALVKPNGWIVIDFMHSEYLKLNLQPESRRVMESGIEVRDTRWIEGNPPRVKKRTDLKYTDGQTETLHESVRLFQPEELRRALREAGVSIDAEYGTYDGNRFSEASSRIIIMGRRQ